MHVASSIIFHHERIARGFSDDDSFQAASFILVQESGDGSAGFQSRRCVRHVKKGDSGGAGEAAFHDPFFVSDGSGDGGLGHRGAWGKADDFGVFKQSLQN